MAARLGDVLVSLPRKLRLEGTARQALDTARSRLAVAGALFAIAFAVIAARLVDVTVLKEAHESRLTSASARPAAPVADRADILDRNGEILATSLATASLYANPRLVLDPADAAGRLAQALPGLNERDVAERLASERGFVWVRRNLTPRQQYAVNRLGIPGLYFQREERRVYPHGPLGAHVIGFTGVDNRGLAGIEQSLDQRLRYADEPVRLSLDIRVQYVLRDEIARAIDEFQAIGGAGLVLDVDTGEIVAMVSLPDFDANTPGLAASDARFNRATLGAYEMGSTFKIFTLAMALESGAVTMRDGFDASRPIQVSRFTISDYKGQNRYLTVPEIFVYSSNIGAAKMALAVGAAGQREFLGRLGLLSPSPVELPEVASPLVPQPWREINTMTVAFGHGISVTPLQLASATAAVVNGVLRAPTLLRRSEHETAPGERVLSRATAVEMRRLLRLVVERGTGKAANVDGYFVGGKTGTAEKNVKGQYQRTAVISSFVGAFPIHQPRYVVLAMLDEPKGNRATQFYATGGWVAAPTVGRLVRRIAPILGLPPVDQQAPAIGDPLLVPVAMR